MIVKMAIYIGFCVYRRSYLIWFPVIFASPLFDCWCIALMELTTPFFSKVGNWVGVYISFSQEETQKNKVLPL